MVVASAGVGAPSVSGKDRMMVWRWRKVAICSVAASVSSCVLQGERDEDRLTNEACALRRLAAEAWDCKDTVPIEYLNANDDSETVELSKAGEAAEPAPTVVTPAEELEYQCRVEQVRIRGRCGPEVEALNACVLEEYDKAREAEEENEAEEGSAYRDVFECLTEDVEFFDPDKKVSAQVTGMTVKRRAPNGDVRVVTVATDAYGGVGPAACLAEQDALVACTAGR